MAYSAVACTLLVILMIVFVGYYVHHKRLKYDSSRGIPGVDLSFMNKPTKRSGIGTVPGQEQYSENVSMPGDCVMNEVEERYITNNPPSYRTQENVKSTSIGGNSQTSSDASSRKLRNENHVLNNKTRQPYHGDRVTTATQVEPEADTSTQHVPYVLGQPNTTRTVCNASNTPGYNDKAWTMDVNATEQTALMSNNNIDLTVSNGEDTSYDEEETSVKS